MSDPDRLAQWFAPVEGELREGGRFTMRFEDGDAPGCHVRVLDDHLNGRDLSDWSAMADELKPAYRAQITY